MARLLLGDMLFLVILGVGTWYTLNWVFRKPGPDKTDEEVKKTTVVMKGKKK